FFQAEDGIRDFHVTGVQTCALPILQTIKSTYRVDDNNFFLTGLSHGGWSASTFVSGDAYGGPYNYADQIAAVVTVQGVTPNDNRSEEHTSELQSREHIVCRLPLAKK